MLPKTDLYGVGVTAADPEQIVAEVRERVRLRGAPIVLAAVNAHTYSEARRDPEFRAALAAADIAWTDGVPVQWAGRLTGRRVGRRIHGHDLMVRLLKEPCSHYFYGSTPEVLEDLRRALPGVRIAGTHSPPHAKRAARADVSMINDSGADIAWIALGAPKQELWAQLNRDQVRVPVIACVGAAFEILAGRRSRAPRALQALGLEWAWRLSQDPARLWRRYLSTNGAFISHILSGWLAGPRERTP